jgi:hypothetical protein
MTATVFLAFSILGLDFLLYALFQWTYGERRWKRRRLRSNSLPTTGARRMGGRSALGHVNLQHPSLRNSNARHPNARQIGDRHSNAAQSGGHAVQSISRMR